tara:strand:- start:464 stop:973 length:510 start_codon:yes stop_codon:yes gene_type:complete
MPSYSTSRELNQQIDKTFLSLKKTLVDYERKDRRRITRKAAQKVAVAARRAPGFRDSKKVRYRKSGNSRIKYNSGNLRRSLRVLTLKKTQDAYVGPQFARKKATAYGGVGQPVDGYYAAMAFGSSLAFRNKVLIPALGRGKNAALKILRSESEKAIASRGVRRGLNFRR